MATLEQIVDVIATALWGDWLLFALLGLGVLYTIMTGGIQLRCLYLIPRGLFKKAENKEKNDAKGCSSIQSLFASLASCVGSGNIVGVSTAILSGGDGALFWMWFAAFFGMATKFGEIVMGVTYHGHDSKGNITGGSFYYISKRLGWHRLGGVVAILLFIQNCGATLIQSNTIAQVMGDAFYMPNVVSALIVGIVVTFVISGGFKRLISVCQRVVPIMAGLYIVGGLVVLLLHIQDVPGMFSNIVTHAFTFQAGAGAAMGYTMKEAMRYGVARGLYSNEAGEGTAPVFHASANVDHPVRQGFYGIIEVFVDTFLICSTTGFVILLTQAHTVSSNAATLTATAFDSVISGMRYIMYVSLLLFAVTSIMNQWYFGHVSLTFLHREHWDKAYRFAFPILIVIGSIGTIHLVWSIQDICLALLIIPNIIAMVFLSKEVRQLTKEFLDPSKGFIYKR